MSKLLVKPSNESLVHCITPKSANWKYVGFELHDLLCGNRVTLQQPGREVCLVILTGEATISVGGKSWEQVGGRKSVFDNQAPGAIYIPAGESAEVSALSSVELAVCSAPGTGASGPARAIDANNMPQEVRGKTTNTRYVRNILPETEPADGLLVVEVITPSGHWSSYPPHKHDRNELPTESLLEETYYHRLQPSSGYVHQRVYTDDRSLDETLSAEDRDVVLVPRGYHPVGVPHGYTNYYLNVMAGPVRQWHFANDPAHEWMLKETV
ncbi:MAG: 5-deoxy-glucuronate isomerase [Gammaproteobacteria bacterium]|nr:5-deoxy-glucuronate isomerase [Gammaproteobacteria bacterium]